MSEYADIVYVDDNDKVVGSGSYHDYIKKGVAVRISRVFIVNGDKVLLQQRSKAIKVSALKWDQSAAGHVDKDESYVAAAHRELKEELGIEVDLKKIGYFYTEDTHPDGTRKRFNTVYLGRYDGPIHFDTEEVNDIKWIKIRDLVAWFRDSPQDFTSTFGETLGLLLNARGVE